MNIFVTNTDVKQCAAEDNLATTILLEMLADKLEEYYWENLIESPQERYS